MDEEKELERVLTRDGDEETELEHALSQDRNEETELAHREEPVIIEPLNQAGTKKHLEKGGFTHSEKHTFRQDTNEASSSRSDSTDKSKAETTPIAPTQPWHSRINPLRSRNIPPVPEQRTASREQNASFLSLLTFQWVNPLMAVGYQRPLELGDIWTVNPNRSVDLLTSRLMESFKRRAARGERNPLVWAMHDTFQYEFWLGGMCNLISSIFQVISPFLTRYLIAFAAQAYESQHTGSPAPNISHGIGLVLGITAMQLCQSAGTNHFIYRGMMVGGQSRAMLINAIYEKSLKISGRAKAGGKALDGEGAHNGIDTVSLKASKDGLLHRVLSKQLHPKGGPKVTPDKAQGVAGDGTGWSNGKILSLMSVDTYRVDQASGLFHILWTSPIQIAIVLVVLCINIGYSALSGFALITIVVPLLTRAIKSLFKRRKAINKITDQRVSLTQEIISSVRFVKFFGWETSFLERLGELRNREIRKIQVLLAIRNAINSASMSMPVFASMLSFITYSLTSHALDPARIFSSLALFNSLRMPLNLAPLVISQVTDARASIGRIQEFLLAEEQEETAEWDEQMEDAVEVQQASFTWERNATHDKERLGLFQSKTEMKAAKDAHKREKKAEKAEKAAKKNHGEDNLSDLTQVGPFKLTDLDFTVKRNELIAVIGTVGSGKSSVLAALAGDMRKTSGKVKMGASRAFCPQYAWIQNTTLKENILFGKPEESDWYNEVVDACALRPDLEILPDGDLTEIGERGITLSGGQKQRLNIARAIYFDADIILMDDPLSAVDAHVGRHIMDHAICGIMKDKCRILATHQLHVLNRCDRIIWMSDDGRITSIDTFDNLMRERADFRQLMASTAQEEDVEKKVDGDDGDGNEDENKGVPKLEKPKHAAGLMQQEERQVKAVKWSVWVAYIKAAGSPFAWPLVVTFLVLANCANITTSLWLSFWTSNKFQLPMGAYIGTYAALGFSQSMLMFAFSTVLSISGTNASKTMLQRAMRRVLRAPMSFFDTTPLGRITNRFSKDVDSMDNNLTDAMRMYFITLTMIISVFILIIVYFHYFAIALGPLFVIFLFASNYYRASAREMNRHEAVLRSHVFARFGESVSGTASIRAYGLQRYFSRRLRDAIDDMDSAYFLTFANQRWLSTRLDAIGNLLVFTTGILVVTSRFNVSPSIAGLVLSFVLAIVQMIQFTVRQLAEVENKMNATERIHYYGSELAEEAPLKRKEVPESWPPSGRITFDNVQMRYRAELPLVLQGLSMHVEGGERIGIVGRTGAGKSSIMSALFRLTELSGGQISIDDIDIATVGLHDLRSRLAIIPQDPTLFKGTIRSNLDPFHQHTDLELWSALRKANLVGPETDPSERPPAADTSVEGVGRIHLDSIVEEEGLNFSLGQRQLMALARALVRDSRIIVCDEATSSVDFETDGKIQETMATGFKGKTLLCIAHRLKTIISYDRICVMDAGKIVELGEPIQLYDQGGIFRGMCDKSGLGRDDFEEAGHLPG
jgi:ATP-binding cassette subfamily C (CFTR/MRP) protein 1